MTTETFTPASPYTISGTGPYAIPFEYSDQLDIRAEVVDGDVVIPLTTSSYTIAPTTYAASGNLTLTSGAATTYAGKTLSITRATRLEQGWVGNQTSREKGLERQIDINTRHGQDIERFLRRVPRLPLLASLSNPMLPVPTAGAILIGSAAGWENGPTVDSLVTVPSSQNRFTTIAELKAYNGPALVVGSTVEILREGFALEVVSSGEHWTTAGGDKVKVLPNGRDFFVDAFNAIGNGSTDDQAAINAAADAVRAAGNSYGLIFTKPVYRATAQLDLTEIRRIQMTGEIRTTVTGSTSAIKIGTETNANTAMEGGDIQIFVRHANATNALLAGTIGIEIKGAARCTFRIYAYTFDIGVKLAPDGNTGIQYMGFNNFDIGTNRCRYGLVFDGVYNSSGSGLGWINQNTFNHADLYPSGNALTGPTIGVDMRQTDYSSNNNVFQHLSVEEQNTPIRILSGLNNVFNNVRMENTTGGVVFGTGVGDQPTCVGNVINVIYSEDVKNVSVDWQASRPNLVSNAWTPPTWVTELSVNYEDFMTVAGGVYSRRLINTVTGTGYFASGLLDATERTFDPGGALRARARIKVQKGDILRVHISRQDSATPLLTMAALDASFAGLGALVAGQVPYLGTDMTTNASGSSGLVNFLECNNAGFRVPFLLSVNRDEVEYVEFQLRAGAKIRSLIVERQVRGGQENDGRVNSVPMVAGITSFATTPLFPGQIGVVGTTKAAVCTTSGVWLPVGTGESATTAQLNDITNAINTTDKLAGKVVLNSTTNHLVRASGATAGATWIGGGVVYTPV